MGAMTKTRLITLLAVAAAALAILPAAASARSTYCSTSGDVCYGVVKGSSPIKLRITTAAKYFSRYRLCITGPHGERECHRFRIRKRNGVYRSTVSWPKHYEYNGKGSYRARWFQGGNALGPAVTF
jgi:hypothetical protein